VIKKRESQSTAGHVLLFTPKIMIFIPFKDIDVSRDRAAARDMVRRSGQQGVPVIDINGKIIVGFNRVKIDRELGL